MDKEPRTRWTRQAFQRATSDFHNSLRNLFSSFFESHSKLEMKTHNDIVHLRNRVAALFDAWLGTKRLESELGIRIALHATPHSVQSFLEKQSRSYSRTYRPCEICGEDRVTHFSHIIPRSRGGPSDDKNYVYLCATHHHLFDHNRLTKEEWQTMDFSKKLEAAQEYVRKIKLPVLEKAWQTKNTKKIGK